MKTSEAKPGLHPRNLHREGYNFGQLVSSCPELGPFVKLNAYGNLSIDFANAKAVRLLNRALLQVHYSIQGWELPEDYLCPPIPGRADYLHHLADLLASDRGELPRGATIRGLDIGVGANGVYPLIGHQTYGWSFVGSDIDARSLASLKKILQANELEAAIELRLQRQTSNLFQGILKPGERFDFSMCNPPFHASAREAREGTERKWRNLGKAPRERLNFGGQGAELWYPGGEAAFIQRMIQESAAIPTQCGWFTTLVSKSANLKGVLHALRQVHPREVRTIEMAQGQKQSRFVAWTFLDKPER